MKRLTQISVTNLFGVFNHTIPLNSDDCITIIHGPNGFGKTAVLRLVDGLFNGRFAELRRTPYTDFRVQFDDSSAITVSPVSDDNQSANERKRESAKLRFTLTSPNTEPQVYISTPLKESESESRLPLGVLDDLIPGLVRTGPREWTYMPTGESFLDIEDVFVRFEAQLGSVAKRVPRFSRTPAWLQGLRSNAHLIATQRLQGASHPRLERSYESERIYRPEARRNMEPAVSLYSRELSERIQVTLAESTKIAQRLDRTFPARVVRHGLQESLASDELRQRLGALEERRSKLMAAGLLDKDNDTEFQIPQQAIDDATIKRLLVVYVQDVEQKLGVLEELAKKIDALTDIINRRFLYKSMRIDPRKGYYFVTDKGDRLSPTDLSSGEQNELVLFYELLFRVNSGSLIMIDEPEISLHIAWQEQFLRDLQQIIQLNELNILIATHSPQIVYDRWDLTVDLAGPEGE